MTSLQSYIDSAPEHVGNMLKYSVGSVSTSIGNKRSVEFQAIGGNSYGPQGVKTINFHLASSQDYLIPDSLSLKVKFKNKDATNPNLLEGSVHLLFSPLRVSVNSVLAEDIQPYGRMIQLLNCLQNAYAAENREITIGELNTSIPADGTETFCMPSTCGLANCGKLLPLKFAPISFALDIESALAHMASHDFELQDVVLMASVCELDGAVQDSIAKHILSSGKGIPIRIETLFTSTQAINSSTGDATINVSKACSRLNALFITFAASATNSLQKDFRRPATATSRYEVQVVLGSRLFPENGLKSYVEMFYHLAELTGLYIDLVNKHIDITKPQFTTQGASGGKRHILGLSMNKDRNSNFSGLSMRNGEVLAITLKSASGVDRCYVTMNMGVIMNISSETTEILARGSICLSKH